MDVLDSEENQQADFANEPKTGGPKKGAAGNKLLQIITSLGVVWTLMVLVSLLTGRLLMVYYGMSTPDILANVSSFLTDFQGKLHPFRLAQMANTSIMFGGASFLMSYLITGKIFGFFEFNSGAKKSSALLIPIIFITVLPVVAFIAFYIKQIDWPEALDELAKMEAQMMLLQEGLIGVPKFGALAVNFLMIAIFPAIFEEFFFRGLLQKLLIQWRFAQKTGEVAEQQSDIKNGVHHSGIIIAGIIFGAFHFQVANFIPITLLGILMGYIYWWTKNLWYPILAHLFFNGIQAISFFVYSTLPQFKELSEIETLPILPTILSLVLCAGAIYLFYQLNKSTVHGIAELD
jgi:membrane protease YdiL (CAAX protease family)